MKADKKMPEDRTALGELWAEAVAEVDDLQEQLLAARNREAEVWRALESSRYRTVQRDDAT